MKKIYNISIFSIVIALSFWLVETVFFNIVYGWHYKAINEAEKLCDDISTNIASVGFWLWIVSVAMIVHRHLYPKSNQLFPFFSKNSRNHKIISDFIDTINKVDDAQYFNSKRTHLGILYWLKSYYEGKTASEPIEYLNRMIEKSSDIYNYATEIYVLYNWVYYKKIVGF